MEYWLKTIGLWITNGIYRNFCTTNSIENAELIGNTLVQEKLAACTNIIPKLTSIYSWDNQIVKDEEVFLIIKTRKELFEDVKTK